MGVGDSSWCVPGCLMSSMTVHCVLPVMLPFRCKHSAPSPPRLPTPHLDSQNRSLPSGVSKEDSETSKPIRSMFSEDCQASEPLCRIFFVDFQASKPIRRSFVLDLHASKPIRRSIFWDLQASKPIRRNIFLKERQNPSAEKFPWISKCQQMHRRTFSCDF